LKLLILYNRFLKRRAEKLRCARVVVVERENVLVGNRSNLLPPWQPDFLIIV
jgi:hypothetical protein